MNTSSDISLENKDPENDTQIAADTPETHTDGHSSTGKLAFRRKLVIFGLILVTAGWVTMMLNEWLSLGCTIAGLVVSCIGVRIPPGPRRDLGTTAIVAASVLLLVYAVFATILALI